jgi:hypothetical protein
LPGARKKRPACPKHDWRCKDQLNPIGGGYANQVRKPEHMSAHLKRNHRQGQKEAEPESTTHVDELGIWPGLLASEHGLKRHTADRAGARPNLSDLRVHRTGVESVGGHRLGFGLLRRKIFLRLGDEFRATAA